MEEHIKRFLIHQLGIDENATGKEEAMFVLRYESQDPEDRQQLLWSELVRELAEQSRLHGLDDVLEAAHIQMQRR